MVTHSRINLLEAFDLTCGCKIRAAERKDCCCLTEQMYESQGKVDRMDHLIRQTEKMSVK